MEVTLLILGLGLLAVTVVGKGAETELMLSDWSQVEGAWLKEVGREDL